MKAISVAAPCNGSGKTSLILSILRAFPNMFAVTKFTTVYGDEQFCPAKDHDCACHRLRGDYVICSDEEVLSQPDTDTGKIVGNGALQTLWCVSRPEGYPAMVDEYLRHYLKTGLPLLMEGNTIAKYLEPQLRLFVVNPSLPESWWKEDTVELLRAADCVVVNDYVTSGWTGKASGEISQILDKVREKSVAASLAPLDQWKDVEPYQAIANLLRQDS
jgi:hypothetical protein